jgi:putative membrane protein
VSTPGLGFFGGNTTLRRVGIIFFIAMIFRSGQCDLKPIVQIISIPRSGCRS